MVLGGGRKLEKHGLTWKNSALIATQVAGCVCEISGHDMEHNMIVSCELYSCISFLHFEVKNVSTSSIANDLKITFSANVNSQLIYI